MSTDRMKLTAEEAPDGHERLVLEMLHEPVFAAEYLNAAAEEGERAFLVALRQVVLARGGIDATAEAISVGRASLYRMLSEEGNPRYENLLALLTQLGLRIRVEAA